MPLLVTKDRQVGVGQIWKYVGESRYGEEYEVTEILPAMKKPSYDWHEGVRYRPLKEVETAPNDYTRFLDDFLVNFTFVRWSHE